MLATKAEVKLIAPELTSVIDGKAQKTRVYIQELTDNIITVDDVEYVYDVQPEDTIEDVMLGLKALIDADTAPIVTVVNTHVETDDTCYLDLRGVYNEAYNVSTPAVTLILEEAVPTAIWDLFAADIDVLINENTFLAEISRGQRYLMAHMLTINSLNSNQPALTSESTGDISLSYADPMSEELLSITKYGRIYTGILFKNRRINFI